jgi:SAM-dependent methyltransferase
VALEELKARQSVMWGSGPYDRISATLADMHEALVARLEPAPDVRWLDVATGTGRVACLAALRGAEVTGLDLAPALVETARELAATGGLEIEFHVGDVEALPYEDGSFDVVSSSVGVMFAPNHEAVAAELARVTRPGGRVGLASWTADGFIGEMFRVISPFAPPPPPGVGNPFAWGDPARVQELLGAAFDLELEELDSLCEFESGDEAWNLFVTSYGPTKTVAASLDDVRREEFRRAFVELHERHRDGDGVRLARRYLMAIGTRR